MRHRRWVGPSIVAATVALTYACVRDDLVACGLESCPVASVCTPGGCATVEAAEACAALVDGDPCSTSTIEGTCMGGACVMRRCGNGIRETPEVCDNGDTNPGDGCSSDCSSLEVCGDNIVDGARLEQCDTGIPGLSGDGCSSRCAVEIELWRQVDPKAPSTRVYAGLAPDRSGRLVFVGGRLGSGYGPPLADDHSWDGTSWGPLVQATELPAVAEHAIAYDTDRRLTVVFGGDYGAGASARTWEWDGVHWIERLPQVSPPARTQARLAYDSVRKRTVLFGGIAPGMGSSSGPLLGDTWEWDGTTWVDVTSAGPSPRAHFAMTFDPDRLETIVVGGTTMIAADSAQTWGWNGAGWRSIGAGSNQPSNQVAGTYDPVAGAVTVFGGGQVYRLGATSWTTSTAGLSFNIPQATWDAVRARVVIAAYEGLFEWDRTTLQRVTPRQRPQITSAVFDRARGVTLGVGPDGVWEWDAARWSRYSIDTTPAGGALFYDAVRDRPCRYGHTGSNTECLTPTGWMQVSNGGPNPTHAITFDEARGVGVMAGGSGGDTWTWDGSAWTQVAFATGEPHPSPRLDAMMTYDPVRERVVLFGGVTHTHQVLVDLWEWDGSHWTAMTPAESPPPRTNAALVYEARRERVVLFGGDESETLTDTWAWDGTRWSQIMPIIAPPTSRVVTAFADARGEVTVLLHTNELWRLRSEAIGMPTERCLDAAADSDGDGLFGCADPDCWGRCAPACLPGTSCTSTARCGDGTCSAVEDSLICATDCP